MLRHRDLSENRFTGTVPSTISALTALKSLCAPFARPGSHQFGACVAARALGCAWALSAVRPDASLGAIRLLGKNGFTGPILASITALTRLVGLYAPSPPVRSSGRLARA